MLATGPRVQVEATPGRLGGVPGVGTAGFQAEGTLPPLYTKGPRLPLQMADPLLATVFSAGSYGALL